MTEEKFSFLYLNTRRTYSLRLCESIRGLLATVRLR
nr:MAG TPA: hypothetical protein [Caudoviricetes sp.]